MKTLSFIYYTSVPRLGDSTVPMTMLASLLLGFVAPTQLPGIQGGGADAHGAEEWRRHGSLQSPAAPGTREIPSWIQRGYGEKVSERFSDLFDHYFFF